jgi:hypothetical protein
MMGVAECSYCAGDRTALHSASCPVRARIAKEPTLTPREFLDSALRLVESESIRAHARSAQNYPIWIQIAEDAIKRAAPGQVDPTRFATYIVIVTTGM